MKIYELAGRFAELYEMADDPDMDAELWLDTAEAVEGELALDAEKYAFVIKQLLADAEAIKAEKDRLAKKQSSLENKANWLKKALQESMQMAGLDKVKGNVLTVSVQPNPPSVFVPDESLVPEEFLIPQPPKVDKKGIASLLKDGVVVEWAELQQGRSLRIR